MISPELLKRYAAGECSAEEIKLVHEWLECHDQVGAVEWKEENLSAMEEQIWLAVKPEKSFLKRNIVISFFTSVSAACMVFLFLNRGFEVNIDNNTGNSDREIVMDDLIVTVKPQSYAKAEDLKKNEDIQLEFCGLLKLTGQKNRTIDLVSDCPIKLNRTFKMRKSAKYYAFVGKNEQGEEVVFFVNKQEMINLYPPLRLELERKYNI